MSQWHQMGRWLFGLVPVAGYFAWPEHLALLSQMAIVALFALSLDLILGYAGIVSLGHAAFFGLGAYTAGLLTQHGWSEPLTGLLGAALVSALFGWFSSFLVLRGTDLTRLMVTLGLALLLFELANKLTGFTGGVDGLSGLTWQPLLGLFAFDLHGKVAYVYSVVVLAALFFVALRLVQSPFGWSLRGIRQNAARMPALGTPVPQRLATIYTIGAAYAGVAGALLTQTTQFVSIDVFQFSRSAEVLLIVVLGGSGHLYGAVLGAVAFMAARQLLSGQSPAFWPFWLGLALLAVVLFARGGLMGLMARMGAKAK